MNTVERSKKFGQDALQKLADDGECLETVQWICQQACKIADRLSDRRLKSCEYAGGVLGVKTLCSVTLWALYTHADDWNDAEKMKAGKWAEVRTILSELAGEVPIRTHERQRKRWTEHWQYLWARGGEDMRKEIKKTALKMYPDFDLSLLDQR